MLKSPHQQKYKHCGRSPAQFRDNLRKECFDRLRTNRFQRQNANRSLDFGSDIKKIIKEIIETEMNGASFEEQMTMFEEIQGDVIKEFDAYEASLAEEENYLAEHLDPDAFCPACKLNPMEVDQTGCLCKQCNFAYQFRKEIIPSKAELAEQLRNCFEEHGRKGCIQYPDPVENIEGLFLVCKYCQGVQQIL